MAKVTTRSKPSNVTVAVPKPKCGLVMPISAMDGCNERHWRDVKDILTKAIEAADFETNLVSVSKPAHIIHKTIVTNLGTNEMVVCDVSCNNPNVMLELGMRLMFDLPVIVVKDNVTKFTFDIQPFVHLIYRRSLHHQSTLQFMKDLTEQVKATYDVWKDGKYNSYRKTFGIVKAPKIETEEVSMYEDISEQLKDIRAAISDVRYRPDVDAPSSLNAHELTEGLLKAMLSEAPSLGMLDNETRNQLCTIVLAFVSKNCVGRNYNLNKAAFHVDERFLKQCPSATGFHPDTRKDLVRAAVRSCYTILGLSSSS